MVIPIKILQFELLKLRKKKLFLWMFLVIFLCTSGLFLHNYAQKSTMKDRALESIQPYEKELGEISQKLREDTLIQSQTEQLDQVVEMNKALFNWKVAIYNEAWDKLPAYEHDFLFALDRFVQFGGEFESLQGVERERAYLKNDWMVKYNVPYVDEMFPLVSALFLVDNVHLLFGAGGLILLLLLFGNILTIEKEQHTWRLLITQPLGRWKLIASKFISLLIVMIVFIISVVAFGTVLTSIFGFHSFGFQYPKIIQSGETVVVISTLHYLLRTTLFFVCACLVTFGLVIFLSRWIQNTFLTLIVTGFILLIGSSLTELVPFSNLLWNPFVFLRVEWLLADIPKTTDWLYLFGAFIFGSGFVILAILLPKKKLGRFYYTEYKKPFFQRKTKTKGSSISKLVIFEYIKEWRKGLLRQTVMLLSLILILGYFLLSERTTEKEMNYFHELTASLTILKEDIIPMQNAHIEYLENKAKIENHVSSELDVFKKGLNILNEQLAKGELAVSEYKSGNWLPLLEYQLFLNRFANQEFESGNIQNEYKTTLDQFSVDVGIAEKIWLIKHEIEPIISGDYVPTIFSQWGDDETQNDWLEANLKVDNNGLFSLYHSFEYNLHFILLIVFVFLFGAGFASERGKKNTLNFLKTQPIAEKYIFLGKLIHSMVFSLLTSLGLFSLIMFIGTVFNGFGNWEYPILYYDHPSVVENLSYTGEKSSLGRGFHFIPLGDYLIKMVILFSLILIFAVVLVIFLSLFFKKTLSVYALTIFIIVLGYIGSTNIMNEFAYLSPFTYYNIPKITNGELSILLDHPDINFLTGSIVLIISIVLLIMIGYWIKHIDRK